MLKTELGTGEILAYAVAEFMCMQWTSQVIKVTWYNEWL